MVTGFTEEMEAFGRSIMAIKVVFNVANNFMAGPVTRIKNIILLNQDVVRPDLILLLRSKLQLGKL